MLMQQVREVLTVNQEMEDQSSWIWLTSEQMGFPCGRILRMRITVKPEIRDNAMTSVLIKPHFFWRLSSQISFETQKRTRWWEARRCAWNARFGMEQRRGYQDAVQPVEHQNTLPRKCVQQEWSSTGETADAVGIAFQTAGRWWPTASAGTRSAYRNRLNLLFRSKDTERSVCQNPSRVATLGRTPC